MPEWMRGKKLPAAAAKHGEAVKPSIPTPVPEAKSSTSDSESVSCSTPRSVQVQPATSKLPSERGPRSLDFTAVCAGSGSPPAAINKPAADSLIPESLKEALSDEEIIEAVDSFFGGGTSSSDLPEESSSPRLGSYESWFAEGQANSKIGMSLEAIECFRKALAFVNRSLQSEQYLQCCTSLGTCYLEHGEGQEAIEWFKRALQCRDLDMERILAIRYEIARGWELMGNFSKARLELEWIAEANPNYRNVEQKIRQLTRPQGD
jgi:tetratricopeptide (TPR) repeat protein